MKRIFVIGGFAAAGLMAQLPPAHAEFFSLDGRFQCLERGAAVCGDAQSVLKPPPAPAPGVTQNPAEPEPIEAAPVAAPIASAAPATAPATVAVARPIDPLQVVAARVQARRPSSNDLAWLAKAASDGNPRAIELLAWCKLNAIGMARDPIEAYLLYGAAGNAALPNARENQRLIYERDLNSDQRQQVLALANEDVALARIMPSAR
jgi:TPR repeat protein